MVRADGMEISQREKGQRLLESNVQSSNSKTPIAAAILELANWRIPQINVPAVVSQV
jgi:hypothetical protein